MFSGVATDRSPPQPLKLNMQRIMRWTPVSRVIQMRGSSKSQRQNFEAQAVRCACTMPDKRVASSDELGASATVLGDVLSPAGIDAASPTVICTVAPDGSISEVRTHRPIFRPRVEIPADAAKRSKYISAHVRNFQEKRRIQLPLFKAIDWTACCGLSSVPVHKIDEAHLPRYAQVRLLHILCVSTMCLRVLAPCVTVYRLQRCPPS